MSETMYDRVGNAISVQSKVHCCSLGFSLNISCNLAGHFFWTIILSLVDDFSGVGAGGWCLGFCVFFFNLAAHYSPSDLLCGSEVELSLSGSQCVFVSC